ncbi:PREDICTED: alpha-aspartyl dipeptidase isoform X2 [Nicrophorus vespilloides]|uniref:Alpha-aspartyl dipeptidase isoform X2 n=1 Tax=Nicrophorus vespilloides TaxID=110193 RepID=A0ABM1M279_NICVS|nr:PREDICTED: alpha-aspartyl dipeptidase isoform X2 [Nicrophorus vespilloides]
MRNLLLISSSRVIGFKYLEVAQDEIKNVLSFVSTVLFIPYALKDYDAYLNTVTQPFTDFGYDIEGIHEHEDPVEAVNKAEAIFIGGGNTFLLLKTLYEKNLLGAIRKRVLENGIPYIGSSAGTNVATCSINTTNDMPIVYPPSFKSLNLVPFNINPHYIESPYKAVHKGETRDQRIAEFLQMEEAGPVLGLREGCMLRVTGDRAVLKGINDAKLFQPGKEPKIIKVNEDLSFLLNN